MLVSGPLLTVVLAASCAPGTDVDRTGAGSFVDRIRADGRLLVAVPYDARPPPGEVNPSLTTYAGFAAEFAEAVATSVDVPVRFAPSPAAAVAVLPRSSSIHISFPLISRRRVLEEGAAATEPYVASWDRLLVSPDQPVGPYRLGRGRVCVATGPWRGFGSVSLSPGTRPFERTLEGCLHHLQSGRARAIAGPDIVLARLAYDSCPRCRIVGTPSDRVLLSAVVPEGRPGFLRHVDSILERAKASGDWRRWYERWIGRYSKGPLPSPP